MADSEHVHEEGGNQNQHEQTQAVIRTKKKKISKLEKKTRKAIESSERDEKATCLDSIDLANIATFSDIPVSDKTREGLSDSGFTKPTDIQKEGIILALKGNDVLGAAKTGSGKTLAFLVPVLEKLWHEQWSSADGLGAIIISPTRELALQTYEVLRKVGKHHDFSAGLIIGGKDLVDEQQRILNTNIIIGTPGRILQHFDETPGFTSYNLKILVLDEADRILDLGFANTLNAIVENLPEERQTLLYSATQTKSVKDLARLSLHNPEYIAVHELSKYITPKKLIQNYIFVDLQDKINFLFSFIRNHLKAKCIVFLSSCKQVKFVYEVFRKLRPGIPLTALYGKQKQLKRVAIYNRFCSIQNAVLFATDIAARGLDFPAVNWVVQYDCPENPDTYIHRVGRTARYEKGGQALMMLLPSEKAIVEKLVNRKIPIHELKSNPKKITSIQGKIQSFCVQDQQMKDWAQKSIISYTRSVYLQGDKSVFDAGKLPLDKFSISCGLLTTPKLNFMKKREKKVGAVEKAIDAEKVKLANHLKNSNIQIGNDVMGGSDESDDDDILVKKTDSQHHEHINEEDGEIKDIIDVKRKPTSKTSFAKKLISKKINVGSRVVFDDDGNQVIGNDEESNINDAQDDSQGIDIDKAKAYMRKQDDIDALKEKERIRMKHKESRKRARKDRQVDSSTEGVTLERSESDDEFSGEDDEESAEEMQTVEPTVKRGKYTNEVLNIVTSTLEEDEGLALHLLGVG